MLPSGPLDVGGGAEPKPASPEKGSGPAGLSPQIRARGQQGATPSAWVWATEDSFTPDELCRLQAALPSYLPLGLVPEDVARAYLLWRGIPAAFTKFRNENGDSTGFSWDRDYTWCRKNPARFETFWRFQNASAVLWQWMSDHPDMEIDSENLLHIWG